MDERIKKQIRLVLGDDNEGILAKLDTGEWLSPEDLQLIRDANKIHVNEATNLNGRQEEAVSLENWLEQRMELSMDEAMKVLEQWLDRDPKTPALVYRALHTLWEEATPW